MTKRIINATKENGSFLTDATISPKIFLTLFIITSLYYTKASRSARTRNVEARIQIAEAKRQGDRGSPSGENAEGSRLPSEDNLSALEPLERRAERRANQTHPLACNAFRAASSCAICLEGPSPSAINSSLRNAPITKCRS